MGFGMLHFYSMKTTKRLSERQKRLTKHHNIRGRERMYKVLALSISALVLCIPIYIKLVAD